jgi:hypothetical protein
MAQLEIFDGTNWIKLGGETNISLTGAISGTGTTSINTTINTIYMQDQGIWLRNSTPFDNNHGIIYNSTIDGMEIRGYGGFNFKIGTAGATQIMRLNNSGIDLGNRNVKGVSPPTLSTDATNQNYVQNAIASSQPSALQYISYWDETYPVYVTRSMYIKNTYNPFIKEQGTFVYYAKNSFSQSLVGTINDAPVYDLKCDGRIRGSEFNAWSSQNLKNILEQGEIVGQEASEIIKNMPIVKYSFKDPMTERTGQFFGVISEQLMEYLPNYVANKEFRFVPNIMLFGILNNIDNTNYSILFDQILQEEIRIGDKIWIVIDKSAIEMYITSINENLINIKANQKVYIQEKNLKVFVYGTYKDCPTISSKHLADLTLCALQDCIKRINKLEKKYE